MALIYSDLTYKVRGVFFIVYNQLGFGHKENVYHRAISIEFKKQNLSFNDEKSLPVKYDNQLVGYYRPDFVVEDKILIEIKAVPFLLKQAETQLIYYLKGTNFMLGLLVNFGSDKLEIKRKIWSRNYQSVVIR